MDQLPLVDHLDGRDGVDLEVGSQPRVVVGVDLRQEHLALSLVGEPFEHGAERAAGAAGGRPEIDDDRGLVGGVEDVGLEGGLADVAHPRRGRRFHLPQPSRLSFHARNNSRTGSASTNGSRPARASIPSAWYTVAATSAGVVGRSFGSAPTRSDDPTTCPPRTPAPANSTDHTPGQWSRPPREFNSGVRPNSPMATTRVLDNNPR